MRTALMYLNFTWSTPLIGFGQVKQFFKFFAPIEIKREGVKSSHHIIHSISLNQVEKDGIERGVGVSFARAKFFDLLLLEFDVFHKGIA